MLPMRACITCHGPLSKNPHPDAGKPSAVLEVGALYECLPCAVRARRDAQQRIRRLERQNQALALCTAKADDVVAIWVMADLDADAFVAAMSYACEAYGAARDDFEELEDE